MTQWGGYQPVYHGHHYPDGLPTCRSCGFHGHMRITNKISTGGWILFVVLIFLCIFLCWIPLVAMKDYAQFCPQCGQLQGGGYG